MEVKFDFSLRLAKYGVVEQAIFKLVLRGIDSAKLISDLLWIFSDEVKAIAIQRLVNKQLLCYDMSSNKLSLSEGTMSIIEACHNKVYTIDLQGTAYSDVFKGTVQIDDSKAIGLILNHMLPTVNIGFLASELVFSVSNVEDTHEE